MTLSSSPSQPRWHRPLMVLAGSMVVLAVVSVAGLILDPRELVGAPIWAKPLKFAISISITLYAVTWAFLIDQLTRFRRVAWWAGTIVAITLAIELVAVVYDTLAGQRSHFNVATTFDAIVWSTMGIAIVVLWLATFVLSVVLWFTRAEDRARGQAVRLASLIALAGLGLGFLMTSPTAAQLADFQGIAGAHTVGAEDGGAGLFLLGWSTTHGDLRVPHFVGIHALQAIPIGLILIEFASRRFAVLRRSAVRVGLVWTMALGYGALVALVTWQALRGQSVVQPDALTALAFGAILLVVTVGVLLSLYRKDPVADPATEDAPLEPARLGAGAGR